jgi:hypothetical protein
MILIHFCLQSCGEETLKNCVEAFYAEPGERAILHEIHNMTPASVVLNKMIEICVDSTHFVPLDADFILYPGFLGRIHDAIGRAKGNWHSILFPLWDTLTQEKIMALKVFRTDVIKDFPFKDLPCPDVQHYKDLGAAGYNAVNLMSQKPIGDHVVRGGYFCYAKYRDLYNVLQAYPDTVLESHFKGGNTVKERAFKHFGFFMKRYCQTGNDDYLYCIAGMVEGLTMPRTGESKDLSDREMRVDVVDAKRLFSKWSGRRYLV